MAGRSGHKLHGPYAASKGAINQFMRVLAHEYAEHGVTANAVAPGYMDTALTRQYLHDHPDTRQALIDLIPAGRFGTLDEVLGPVLSPSYAVWHPARPPVIVVPWLDHAVLAVGFAERPGHTSRRKAQSWPRGARRPTRKWSN